MTERYVSLAGPTMHTGWMKKIGILEQQMALALRNITELQKKMKELESKALAEVLSELPKGNVWTEAIVSTPGHPAQTTPVKRGPGRPRKNPQ
jgi:hypothetical protein